MNLDAFAGYLRTSKESALQRWLEAVRGDPGQMPAARDLPEPQLRNDVPVLLDEIIRTLEGTGTPAVEAEGREHGKQRWDAGYNIAEVLRELTILRETLMGVVDDYAHGTPGLSYDEAMAVRRRLRSVIDRSAQGGVTQFHTEAIAEQQRLQQELKAANEQKDRFLAMLAHELRNPLAPILTAVQLLEFTEAADPRLRRARDVIERQVRHQARLIDDLLNASRITHGKLDLRLETCNVGNAVALSVETCLPAFAAKGQQLHVAVPEEPLPAEADLIRLEQVVTNLLVNASRYTDPGGEIWLTVSRQGDQAVISVRDTGIGISPEVLPRVFDLFTQGDTSLDRPQGGLGIGLALVKALIELHGGTVEAQSAGAGAGSEFVVRLPIVTAALPAPASAAGGVRQADVKPCVGLVEDNTDARITLAELLEMTGYRVVTAADGLAALTLAKVEHPDVFLVDIGLPGIDGYEVARRLRQTPASKDLFLIALTGYGSPEDEERARTAGFDAHLTKPADIGELDRLLTQRPLPNRAA